MTLEEYIEKNFSTDKLNEFSTFSGWHDVILEIVRETWKAAEQSLALDGVECTCDLQSDTPSVIHETSCPLFSTRRK